MASATFIALLRGVNVGGHRRLAMADLRQIAEGLGHRDVQTYIQSGNLVFTADAADPGEVAEALEARLASRAGITTRVALRTASALQAVVTDNPFAARGADVKHLHAGFLFPGDAEALASAEGLAERIAPEEISIGTDVVWIFAPNGLGRSNLGKLGKLGQHLGTVRNWRTITRLGEMAGAERP